MRGIAKYSITTASDMASGSTIEGLHTYFTAGALAGGTIGPQLEMRYTGSVYRFSSYDGAFHDIASAPYVASTKYILTIQWDGTARKYLYNVNGVTLDPATNARNAAISPDRVTFQEDDGSKDCHVYLDDLIVCNLDVDTVAKSQSGGYAGGQRLPVLDNLPAGVVG
jgi:hypothetical protein